eukprot:344096-Amphidinium_carterae.2
MNKKVPYLGQHRVALGAATHHSCPQSVSGTYCQIAGHGEQYGQIVGLGSYRAGPKVAVEDVQSDLQPRMPCTPLWALVT